MCNYSPVAVVFLFGTYVLLVGLEGNQPVVVSAAGTVCMVINMIMYSGPVAGVGSSPSPLCIENKGGVALCGFIEWFHHQSIHAHPGFISPGHPRFISPKRLYMYI